MKIRRFAFASVSCLGIGLTALGCEVAKDAVQGVTTEVQQGLRDKGRDAVNRVSDAASEQVREGIRGDGQQDPQEDDRPAPASDED